MRLWKRHTCPRDIELTLKIAGRIIVGPVTGENLALMALYGNAEDDVLDIMAPEGVAVLSHLVSCEIRPLPRRKR